MNMILSIKAKHSTVVWHTIIDIFTVTLQLKKKKAGT